MPDGVGVTGDEIGCGRLRSVNVASHPRWSTPSAATRAATAPAERPCCTAANAGVTVSDSCILGRHSTAEAEGPAWCPSVRASAATGARPEVRPVRRHAHEQQGAVMTGDSTTTMGAQLPPAWPGCAAPRRPGPGRPRTRRGPVGSARRDLTRCRDVATGQSGVPQIGQVDDAVLVGGVHPVPWRPADGVASVSGRRRAGLWTTVVDLPDSARLPVDALTGDHGQPSGLTGSQGRAGAGRDREGARRGGG